MNNENKGRGAIWENFTLAQAKQRTRFNLHTKLLAPMLLLLAVAVAVGLYRFKQINEVAPDFATLSPHTRTTQLTNNGQVLRAAISPDGKYVADIRSQRGHRLICMVYFTTFI